MLAIALPRGGRGWGLRRPKAVWTAVFLAAFFLGYLASGGIWELQVSGKSVWRMNKLTGEAIYCPGGACKSFAR